MAYVKGKANSFNRQNIIFIWLDQDFNSNVNQELLKMLKDDTDNLKIFTDIHKCRKFIEQRTKNDRMIIIVSGKLGKDLVPHIQTFSKIIKIYIFCQDVESHRVWAQKYEKVKAVVSTPREIRYFVKINVLNPRIDDKSLWTAFIKDAEKSTSVPCHKSYFIELLMDLVIKLKTFEQDTIDLINRYKQEDETDDVKDIDSLRTSYSSEDILKWYTKESFFYKKLNKALRDEDIHILLLFRSYIADMQNQLKRRQTQNSIEVYRGQIISKNELHVLKRCAGKTVVMKSFLSTSGTKERALRFAQSDLEEGQVSILLKITADPKVDTTKSFADISEFSRFPDEKETLFMARSIFRINSVTDDNTHQMPVVDMTLCGEKEHYNMNVMNYLKQQFITKQEENFQTLGNILRAMGEFESAQKYFEPLLESLATHDPLRIILYEELALLMALYRKDYRGSIEYYEKLVKFKNPTVAPCKSITSKLNSHDSIQIPKRSEWTCDGVTVAGCTTSGNELTKLRRCTSVRCDGYESMFIADFGNHRIVEWKPGATIGKVVAGGNGEGNANNQLDGPSDVIIDRKTNSFLICDMSNRRVVRWTRDNNPKSETIIENIDCCGLAMDDDSFLYVSDIEKHEVRRYEVEGNSWAKKYVIVAGGHGQGAGSHQLNEPSFLFVDKERNVYVSDKFNNRVMKWEKNAKKGVAVAGVGARGEDKISLKHPRGLFVDLHKNVYVVDSQNHRVVCWSTEVDPIVVLGGNDPGDNANKLDKPMGLSMDRHGSIYVADMSNHRIQRFSIINHTPKLSSRRWEQNAQTIAGSHKSGSTVNELYQCCGIVVDKNGSILIADRANNRVVEWKPNITYGGVVAGGNGEGYALNQLRRPTDVIIDRMRNDLLICDEGNRRIVRWTRHKCQQKGVIINDIDCYGLAMDDSGGLYVSNTKVHEVWYFKPKGNSFDPYYNIAAGNGKQGNLLDHLDHPTFLCADQHGSIYISDTNNNRVMKWIKDAKKGIVVAGKSDEDDDRIQLSKPTGLFVNSSGVIYIVDSENHRVVSWYQGVEEIIVGGNGYGSGSNQLNYPEGLSMDQDENIYVADFRNSRIQKFATIKN